MRRPRLAALALAAASLVGGAVLAGCGGDDAAAPPELSPAGERGAAIAEANGCTSCHTADGSRAEGPTWKDLAGSERELESGETVVADDAYLERSILAPREQLVAGYPPIMPVYENQLDDAELADLLAYLRDLSPGAAAV